MAARLRQIEDSTHSALIPRQQAAVEAAMEARPAPARFIVPVPRRGRVFLRHGEGHGVFSNVTLTSPLRAHEVKPA